MNRTIKHITATSDRQSFRVTYTSNWVEDIHVKTDSRRFAACQRLINAGVWSVFGGGYGFSTVYTPAPVVQYVPTLAESFALAAVAGFKELDPSSVSSFETMAAECERMALNPTHFRNWQPDTQRGNARRAILYRFYARSLIAGRADYEAILAAYQGVE